MLTILNITAGVFLFIAATISAVALPFCAAMVFGLAPRKHRHRPF